MNIKALLNDLLSQGKSDVEIAQSLVSYKGEDAPKSVEALAKAVEDARTERELLKKLVESTAAREKEAQEKAVQLEINNKIEEALREKMLSLNLSLSDSVASRTNKMKRFDRRSGQIIEVHEESDCYVGFKDMLRALTMKDVKSAWAISGDIDKENEKVRYGSKATPTVTDVASRGGYAVPVEVQMTIAQLTQASSRVLPLVNQDVVNYESKVYPVMFGITVDYIENQSTALTETNPAFTNPTINMQRLGAHSAVSHNFLKEKGNDGVQAFINAYSSAAASKLDQQITIGNITNAADRVDGIVFDPNTYLPTPIALADFDLEKLVNLKNSLHFEANYRLAMLTSPVVYDKMGLWESTGGNKLFPQVIQGLPFSPFGIPIYKIPQITDTLDVGGDNRTGGTDSVLIIADMSKVVVGLDENLRIDSSEHFLFTQDSIVMRVIQEFGMKVLMGASNAGKVAAAQELTN